MRRLLSISLILVLWLPAFASLLPGDGESRLPFCCRRHGVHHCAMDAESASGQVSHTGPFLHGSSRCPSFPAGLAATRHSHLAIETGIKAWLGLAVRAFTPAASRDAARWSRLGTHTDRGPPVQAIA